MKTVESKVKTVSTEEAKKSSNSFSTIYTVWEAIVKLIT
jgi:hypothetical protein